MSKQTITINGTVYDSKTGAIVRVERTATERRPAVSASATVHARPQKSHTLQRRYMTKSKTTAKSSVEPARPIIQRHRAPQRTPRPVKHPDVVRFAQTIREVSAPARPSSPDIAPTKHTVAQAAAARQAAARRNQQRTVLPSQVIKQQAIAAATQEMKPRTHQKDVKQHTKQSLLRRSLRIASISLAAILIGAYFTYLNMPALSTRIAATQAGINAAYPTYQPSGYSLNGPVAYEKGSVVMNFSSNGSSEKFALTQTQSNWDSSAVLENYVKPNSNDKYTTDTVNGLTIYTYNTTSVWVNGGILYTVTGDAHLAPGQVQKLATSL